MNMFYMMVGLPGSGKSTWIAEHLQGVLAVSSDTVIEQQAALYGTTYDAIFSDCVDEACRLCAENLMSAIAEDRDVVLDQTNLTIKIRTGKLQSVPPTYRKIAVVVLCASAVELERRQYRPGKIIREEMLVAMHNSFVFPTKDEGFDEIRIVLASLQEETFIGPSSVHRGEIKKLRSSSGREYLAVEISEEAAAQHLASLLSLVGEEEFHRHVQNKRRRDGDGLHLTIVAPDEYELTKAKHISFGNDEASFSLLGLGSVAANRDRAYYIAVESDGIAHLRSSLGLPDKALHITLGFSEDDVHDADKGRSTIIATL